MASVEKIESGGKPAPDEGKRIAAYSFVLNFFLTLVKYLLFLLTGSGALLAETVHSLTDVVGSLLVLGGIYLAGKKSPRFPMGLYKAENLAALLSAGFVFVSGYEIARTILHPSPGGMTHLDITLVILILMSLPIFLFYRYERRKGRELNSPSLLADAENWRTDLAPLTVVVAGIVGVRFSSAHFDRVAAFIVLLMVVKAGYTIARDAVRSLLDASVDKATLVDMAAIIKEIQEVTKLVSLTAHNSGRYIFANIEVQLSITRLKEAHVIVDRMEQEIRHRIPYMEKVTVHYEPETKERTRYAVMLETQKGAISEHFAAAPLIALWERQIASGTDLFPDFIENPFKDMGKGKGIRLAEFLVGRKSIYSIPVRILPVRDLRTFSLTPESM